ncbi:hypothetical protein KAT36_03305 [Candidatus Pacearchaeota archaeon]|nr:hypothetical protein [Candidatus Pacearchaeota archaeon]
MNIVAKVANKLCKNFKILNYSLLVQRQERVEDSKSELVWNRTIATSCGAYPIYFPRRREITDTFFGNLFLLTSFFIWLSYRNINQKLKKKNSIYVSLNEMDTFMRNVLPKISMPFVLVTGDSDYPASKFKKILKNKFLVHWFAQNNNIRDNRITSIPIGLDFHTLLTEDYFGETRDSVKNQERKLNKIRNQKLQQELKVFANFHLNCTSNRRKELYNLLKNNSCMFFQKGRMPRTEMWKLQKQFVFNFSPVGNGLDCVRTWEALVLGQIPIVERTKTLLDDLHKQFPIVIIDDVSEINVKNLEVWYNKYSKQFGRNLEKKLTNGYWVRLIEKRWS